MAIRGIAISAGVFNLVRGLDAVYGCQNVCVISCLVCAEGERFGGSRLPEVITVYRPVSPIAPLFERSL
ncbi:hypothetical protein U1Q18_051132, partial [Sarracenia purpurea var. burkii]